MHSWRGEEALVESLWYMHLGAGQDGAGPGILMAVVFVDVLLRFGALLTLPVGVWWPSQPRICDTSVPV